MLATETRIRELAAAIDSMKTVIEGVNSRADTKIEQMKGFVQEVEGRFNQLERSIPERIHILESKSENFVAMVNGLAGQIQSRFEEIESVPYAHSTFENGMRSTSRLRKSSSLSMAAMGRTRSGRTA